MRIIDKYLLKEFLLPLMYCLDAFLLLFIVQDLLGHLTEFVQFHTPVSQVVRYYLIILPEAFVLMLPVALLLAALFCLSNLGKNNELIALRSSGVSLLRLTVPFLCVGAVASVAVFGVNEAFVPRAKERADAFMSELHGKGSREVIANFFYKNETAQHDWYAQQFNPRARQLTGVEIHQLRPDGTPWLEVFAESAVWTNSYWLFRKAVVYDHSDAVDKVSRVAETNFPAFNEPPRLLALEGRKPDQLFTHELRRHINALKRSGRVFRLSEYEVALYSRYSFPLTSLIVVWLAIPLGMRVSKRGALMGVGTALGLVVAYYFLMHFAQVLGNGSRIPPPLAAWLTNGVFAAVGAGLMLSAR